MAKKIKVKTLIILDSKKSYINEIEESFDGNMYGRDLAEAVIKLRNFWAIIQENLINFSIYIFDSLIFRIFTGNWIEVNILIFLIFL